MNKFLILVTAFLSTSLFAEDDFLIQLQQELHKRGDPWVAGHTKVSQLPPDQQKSLFSTIDPEVIPSRGTAKLRKRTKSKALPTYWDWRTVDGQNWMTHAKDQDYPQTCGSCWCFANIGQFEARLNISNGQPNYDLNLSEQFQVSCDATSNGCFGGNIINAAEYTVTTGIPDEACFAYVASEPPCNNRCSDWAIRVQKAKDYGATDSSSLYKTAIYEGPVSGSFILGKDFLYYKGGTYEYVMGEKMAAHAMTVCGWNDANTYWLIKNTWGEDWGDRGFGWVNPATLQYIAWSITNDPAAPAVQLRDKRIINDADGIWNPNETADIVVDLRNWGANATNVEATFSILSGGPYLTLLDGDATFGTIAAREVADNSSNAFQVNAATGIPQPYNAQFKINVTADGGYSKDFYFNMPIGPTPEFHLPPTVSSVYGMVFDDTFLWISDYNVTSIYKLSQQGYVISEIPAPGGLKCTGLAYENGNLWVQNEATKKIYKINPANGQILTSFFSPATQTPTGLAFDGTHLWATDRDAYKIYKITTSGSTVSSITVPVTPQVLYGPRELAFDPRGPDGGCLILYMTHYHQASGVNILDSTVIWDILRDGTLGTHRFRVPDTNGRAVEVNPQTGKYWVNSMVPNKIYTVAGFYEPGVEEKPSQKEMEFIAISPNPTEYRVSFKFYIPVERKVNIDVYNVAGRSVYKVDKLFKPGEHTVDWDCRKLKAGAYLCVLKTGTIRETKKLMLLK